MNSTTVAESFYILALLFFSSSLASLVAFVGNVLMQNKIKLFRGHRFVWLCVFLSGFVVALTIMICFTPWQLFFIDVFKQNVFYYCILFLTVFCVVLVGRFVLLYAFVFYFLYSGLSFYTVRSSCLKATQSISVTAFEAKEGIVHISYAQFSPRLLLPFSSIWITKINAQDLSGGQFAKKTRVGLRGCFPNFLCSKSIVKTLTVEVPSPQVPPEKWTIDTFVKDLSMQYSLKRLL